MTRVRVLAMVALMAAWGIPRNLISETGRGSKVTRFSGNGNYGVVEAGVYTARIRRSGTVVVTVRDTMEFDASFIQIWKHYQHFPHVKYAEAVFREDRRHDSVIIRFRYFWNSGQVREKLVFTANAIEVSYIYTPDIDKKTANILCLLTLRKPRQQPQGVRLIGMDRSIEANGALLDLGRWRPIRRPKLRMLRPRNIGRYTVDFLAEANAWINVTKWPRLMIMDNGSYPLWDRTLYKAGEQKILKYTVAISNSNGTNLKPARVTFRRFHEKQ